MGRISNKPRKDEDWTSIRIKVKTANEIISLKGHQKESYEDVIKELIKERRMIFKEDMMEKISQELKKQKKEV